MRSDFCEIGHTGGVASFTVTSDAEGHITYQTGYSSSAPRPASRVGIWAHPDGFARDNMRLGGLGEPSNAPPLANCLPVLMASDSEGRFGHECPRCHKHFRTENIPESYPLTCPYCGLRIRAFKFLTPAQNAYVKHYVGTLLGAIEVIEPGAKAEVVINMDELADAVPGEHRQMRSGKLSRNLIPLQGTS